MSMKDFLAAMSTEREPPCERFECAERQRCADQLLACTAFSYYVRSGRSEPPYMVIPAVVSKHQQPVIGDKPEPTSETFESLCSDDDPQDETPPETQAAKRRAEFVRVAMAGSANRVRSVFDVEGSA